MKIGTVRPEEAKVFDGRTGYHKFHNEDGEPYGSFEVFWNDRNDYFVDEEGDILPSGWYWWACFPGCLPDGEYPMGPFASSLDAYLDANPYDPEFNEED